MQEISNQSEFNLIHHQQDNYVERIRGELLTTLNNPVVKDPYHYACSEALLQLLDVPAAQELINTNLAKRAKLKTGENLPSWGLERMATTALHMIAWEPFDILGTSSYPEFYTTPKPWQQIGKRAFGLANGQPDHRLLDVLGWLDLNTIKEGRRNVMELVLTAYSDRWDHPNILDIGCSRGDLLLMTAMNEPHPPFNIAGSQDDELASRTANTALAKAKPPLGLRHGVDIYPFPDPYIYGQWFNSNYLRFAKVSNPELVRLCKTMGSLSLRKLYGIEQMSDDFSAEILNPMTKSGYKVQYAEQYDIIQYSFMLYQLSEKRREQAISNGLKLLAPDGIMLINDVVKPTEGNSGIPDFPDNDTGNVRSLIFDNRNPEYDFQELFLMKDGEFNQGTIGSGPFSQEMWDLLKKKY